MPFMRYRLMTAVGVTSGFNAAAVASSTLNVPARAFRRVYVRFFARPVVLPGRYANGKPFKTARLASHASELILDQFAAPVDRKAIAAVHQISYAAHSVA